MNVIKLVKKIAIEIPEQEAWWLVQKITSKNKSFLLLNRTIQLTSDQEITLFKWVNERINKKPLQYILGSVPFCNLDILVKPPILIPRPETEEWSSDLIKKLPNIPLNILDLCSGSGCITLALAKALPKARVIGLDIEQEAIDLALENKRHNDIHNVDFIKSDLYEAVHHKTFDLIVGNPPYVSESDWLIMNPEITKWENKIALVANENGFFLIRKIIEQAKIFLNKNSLFKNIPQLLIEIGDTQGKEVIQLLKNNNFTNISIKKDLAEKDRLAIANI